MSCAPSMPRREVARIAPRPRRRRRHRDVHAAARRDRSAVTLWCETPRWRSRGSANETRSARDRHAAEPGGGVEDGADLDAAEAEAGAVPTMPGPIATTPRRRRATWRATASALVDRDRLVVAAERVPAGDRGVEELARRGARRRGRRARAAARRRRSSRTRAAPSGARVLERDRDRGELAVQRGRDDRHARRSSRRRPAPGRAPRRCRRRPAGSCSAP